MKLLFDQNLSFKLVTQLSEIFPNSAHVFLLGLHTETDDTIWQYARDNQFVIVTKDADFHERSLLYGHPPKVIWLRIGNVSTESIYECLIRDQTAIVAFEKENASCLILK